MIHPSGMQEHLKILVVDDDEVDRMVVRRALRAAGINADITEVEDARTGLEILQEVAFDCAFLDYQLPGGDGLRVLSEARRAGVHTPIVMMTGHDDAELAVAMMKAGATDYVPKGAVSADRLERSIRTALRLHQAETQARNAQAALQESEARFRVLHETSPDGFMILRSVRDPDGAIEDFEWVYVNPSAARMVKRSVSDLVGKRLLVEHPGNKAEGVFDAYVEVVESGEPWLTEIHYTHDGLDLWLRITAVKLGDGFAVGFSDIARRKLAEEEREKAISARGRFYANMSHELRTPINAVLGYNDLLLAGVYGPLAEKQLKGIERSQRAAQHLLELVNDVLDLSKLEAGKMELVIEPVSALALVEDLFTTIRPMAEERGSELVLHAENCPDSITTDPRRARQILLNLLSNAIKFGEGKPVEVRCIGVPDGGVRIEVVDQGIGIPTADLPRIFEEFVQLEEADQRGTGLGLPISRRLAKLLGGTLKAESLPGVGSTFCLSLPAAHPTG
ncbi:MAG: ATP-binding protein [Gemmatimonadota bacterium]|nr:ATP-binding protein [Gemmatimonadota bacterium]